MRLTTHLHLQPRLKMSGLLTPRLRGLKSENVTSLLVVIDILRIIRKNTVNGVFRDVIHIIYHGVISEVP